MLEVKRKKIPIPVFLQNQRISLPTVPMANKSNIVIVFVLPNTSTMKTRVQQKNKKLLTRMAPVYDQFCKSKSRNGDWI